MSESWLSGFAMAPWAPVVAAYVFGIATGWLIWGGRRSVPNGHAAPVNAGADDGAKRSEEKAVVKSGAPEADPCPAPMKLGALESEIRKAREMLSESEAEADAFADELSVLDQSLKRANGRLKLILRAVKRAKPET